MDNPESFNQKIQWLKLYDSTEIKGRLADKFLVREWIEDKLGQEYLVPLLGSWKNPSDIDFDALPSSFVLKTTLGSGTNLFIKDKAKVDFEAIRQQLNEWMTTDYALSNGSFELHYSLVQPRIIAEEYMDFSSSVDELIDYRFFCSWGKVFSIWCDIGSATHDYRRSVFDSSWKELDVKTGHPKAVPALPKPQHAEKMKAIAELLSKDFAFSRVDLYEYEGQIKFGEITFTPQSGSIDFIPTSFNYWMGSNITLPTKKKPFKGIML